MYQYPDDGLLTKDVGQNPDARVCKLAEKLSRSKIKRCCCKLPIGMHDRLQTHTTHKRIYLGAKRTIRFGLLRSECHCIDLRKRICDNIVMWWRGLFHLAVAICHLSSYKRSLLLCCRMCILQESPLHTTHNSAGANSSSNNTITILTTKATSGNPLSRERMVHRKENRARRKIKAVFSFSLLLHTQYYSAYCDERLK